MSHLIITGASRGIGFATAQLFLQQGWQVLSLSRSKPKDDRIKHIYCDLADLNAVTVIQEQLISFINGAEKIVLVHNAAAYEKDSINTIDAARFNEALIANLVMPAQLNRVLIPLMKACDAIIYIGSTLSEKAVAGAASYTIAKHGVVGMMRATCQDLAHQEIHTCCICPGFTDTEMVREHLQQNPDVLNSIKSRVGANRLVEPNEIAAVIWFAAMNPVINGAVLHANLGQIEQ